MAFVLKGLAAEINVTITAQFSELSTDSFCAVIKRGNDDAFKNLLAKLGSGEYTDRQMLDDHIIKLTGLTDSDGNLINDNGEMQWLPAGYAASGRELTEMESQTLETIDLMLGANVYRTALLNAVFEGVGNKPIYLKAKLGN